jgi:putative membrane-bound dehydrogenase-like protein
MLTLKFGVALQKKVLTMVIERIEMQLRMVCLCGVLLGIWLPRNAAAQTQELSLGDYRFTIPAGMKLERATVGELTTWPIVADWDQRGRLLVVESGGVSKPIEEHNKQLLHRVVRLEDTDGDGVFDSRTLVAKDLPFMEGVLCLGNDMLVTAPPHIYRLQDADGDGVCETRELWFDGQTITGCANDLHGPFLGRDGWSYWCKGAFAEQRHELLNGGQLVTNASHIFRRKLSGGAIEPVMTGGMDNPVELAITPEGERFFTSTFLHHPGNGLRDGVAHAVYGGLYGKEQRAIEGHVRTGALMPIMVNLGAAAPSGLLCLDANQLLPEQLAGQRTLVAALFNLQKVTAHTLTPQGATFTTQNLDLVVGDRVDFHPTDVIEDADGSLLIIDTGGWYNLCCPSSRVDQQTAAGGIYRLSRESGAAIPGSAVPGSPVVGQPTAAVDLNQPAQRDEIVRWLCDARPWVARRTQLQLSTLSDEAIEGVVPVLARALDDTALTVDQKLKCLWGLCTIGNPSALQAITRSLTTAQGTANPATTGRDPSLLQAACHALSLHRFSAAQPALLPLLRHPAAHVRRTAAEALGRLGNEAAADALIAALPAAGATDRHQQHSVTYALIELKAAEVALAWLDVSQRPVPASADQKLVALIALEQLGQSEKLTPAMLLDGLSSNDENLRRTSSEILARHPQWGAKFRESIYELFAAASLDRQSTAAAPLATVLAGWRETPTVQAAMAQWLSTAPGSSASTQDLLVQLLTAWSDSNLPDPLAQPLATWMSQAQPTRQLQLAQILGKINLSEAAEVRDQLLTQAKRTVQLSAKLQFLSCLPAGTQCQDPQLEQSILDGLRQSPEAGLAQPSGQELKDAREGEQELAGAGESSQALALRTLQRVQLSLSAGQQLLSQLTDYPPRILPIVIEAIARVGHDELDAELLGQLRETPAARTLSEDQLLNLYRTRSAHLRTAAAATMAHLTRPPSDIEQKLDEVLARLTPGDPVRGLQLFRSNKTACSGCHRLGYVGGEIGPNLTKIGSTRTRRAILEAILFPSARLEQSYQPTKILTHDGQVYNGLITKHLSPTQFELQLTADKSLILSTDDVAEQEASQLSIMPSGLAELLTPEELSDLMAILESAK